MNKEYYPLMRKNILVSMIIVPFIPFLIMLGIGYYYFTTSLETNTIETITRIVDNHCQMLETFLNERKAGLKLVCSSYGYKELVHPEILKNVFIDLQTVSNAFVDIGVFNSDGVHVAYYGPYELTGKVYGETDWFREVMRKGYYISDVFLGYRNIPHFIIAVAEEKEGIKWVLRATIDTTMFNSLVQTVRVGKTGEAYILNREGIFQTDRRSGGNLMGKDPDYKIYSLIHDGIKTFIGKDIHSERYLYAAAWLNNGNWLLVVRQEKGDAFVALRSASYLIVITGLLGGVIIVGLAFYQTDKVIRRIEKLDKERESLSRLLIRASQLAELGEMAAGFAHEINNPLQIIMNEQTLITDILKVMKRQGSLRQIESLIELEDSVSQISEQIGRCAKITQAIMKFGRKQEPVTEDVLLQDAVDEVRAMVDQNARVHGIKIVMDIPYSIPVIHGDKGQLQQVLLNLFNNAIDSINSRDGFSGGIISLQAINAENGSVKIFIRDNGCGISPENMKKVFLPFFTTKPAGKGTGLGLSVCYGIIEGMGGTMEVESVHGGGTSFIVCLPAVA